MLNSFIQAICLISRKIFNRLFLPGMVRKNGTEKAALFCASINLLQCYTVELLLFWNPYNE